MQTTKQQLLRYSGRWLALFALFGLAIVTLKTPTDHRTLGHWQLLMLPMVLLAGWIGYLGSSGRFTNPPLVMVARSLSGALGAAFLIVLLYPLVHGTQFTAAYAALHALSPTLTPALRQLDGASVAAYVAASVVGTVGSEQRYRNWYGNSRIVARIRRRTPSIAPTWT